VKGGRSAGRGAVEISGLTAGGVQHPRPIPLWVREQLESAHGNNMVLAVKDVHRLVHADPVVAMAASERPVVAWHRTSLASARLSHVGVSRQTSRGSRAATRAIPDGSPGGYEKTQIQGIGSHATTSAGASQRTTTLGRTPPSAVTVAQARRARIRGRRRIPGARRCGFAAHGARRAADGAYGVAS
jgi:hypothetical protein